MLPLAALPRLGRKLVTRTLQTVAARDGTDVVNIVEVGPRDGLQNEKAVIPPSVKAELVTRLGRAGMKNIESGSFVSPKWVPQMAGTPEVLRSMERLPGAHYPVLVPNMKGLDNLFELLDTASAGDVPLTDEIAIFTAATDAFCKANTNCTIPNRSSGSRPSPSAPRQRGCAYAGIYVSVVVRVREISRALLDMGCYEVSLGDTVGAGTPWDIRAMLETVMSGAGALPAPQLAGHFHDTYAPLGLRTFDASVAGLGGCPYSPGATGNVATEDVLYALQGSGYKTPGNLDALAEVGGWISGVLGRRNESGEEKDTAIVKERERDGGAAESVAGVDIDVGASKREARIVGERERDGGAAELLSGIGDVDVAKKRRQENIAKERERDGGAAENL
ncbi:uncharacterized protein B0H18DRAFT_1042194 [Fomitopsis serialis]|uniref:uncharacterized protein n=1 Tax=Fomitopsis serialis TaxID=139415 RepID=UPI002007748D|nr:uncharacterized protein B0H18DRAFT_1042194 [Neoantrodia serialis]KAH9915216.1 hypothetical protein B0H18DRAFT_1042194 [Neoantrodia serialis]